MNIEDNIDFLTSHFDYESLFPRKMMTKIFNYQFSINSKEVIVQKCIESNFVDCRINAYPEFTMWNKYHISLYPPNFIFIDLDLSTFSKCKNPGKMLDKALKKTLKKISVTFSQEYSHQSQHSPQNNFHQPYDNKENDINPTVLWSGNGYHIYLPVKALILDDFEPFSKEKFQSLFSLHGGKYYGYSVSEVFLSFANQYFTDGKADPQHRPKYKTCLIRIPDIYNSKCLEKGSSFEDSKVKVIQKWNGFRPPIQLLTRAFWKWLIQEETKQSIKASSIKYGQINTYRKSTDFQIQWIEKLLQVPLEDYRKTCLWRILCPYLVNVKKLSTEQAALILQEWLRKCNVLRMTDFNHYQQIKNDLKNVGIHSPLSYETVKEKEPELYDLLKSKNIM